MSEILDKSKFEIDVNRYNPNGFCLIHIELNDAGEPVDWTFVYANDALARLEGKSVEELMGHRFYEIFPDGDRKWLKYYFDAAYHEQSASIEDVSEEVGRYLHIDAYPTGTPGYCICLLRDIREPMKKRAQDRKKLESLIGQLEAEKHLNAKVREFAQTMGMAYPLAISIDYKNDRYHMIEYDNFINKTTPRSGDIEELVNVGASTIPDPKAAQQFVKLFNKESAMAAFAQGKREISLRHPQNGDDGKVHYMDTKIICTEYSEDRIEGLSLSRCIDEEREKDQAIVLETQHAEVIGALGTLYRTVMEADIPRHRYRVIKSIAGMKEATNGNDEGDFDEVKEQVIEYFMKESCRDYMRTYLDLGTLSQRLENIDTIREEYQNKCGEWLESRFIVKKRDQDGHAVTALYVARDITSEKEKEIAYIQQLKETSIEAEKANVSKTNFLRRMSHDIRTPLNGIMGMLRIAQRYREDPEKFEDCMQKISGSADYLMDLVNNVLDISKLESGNIELEHKPFDIGQVLLNTLPAVETSASQNSLVFKGGREDTHIEHRYLVGSPVHLNRILMNIASNAVKYNRPGGMVRIYCNELSSDDNDATFEFICEDTGLGMSEEFQKRAFDPFSQEGKETTTSFSGSGLGLSIVKSIVDLMGGSIELESKEDVGTKIRVVLTFPIAHDYVHEESEDADQEKVDVSGCRALLVEDNALNMEIARIMLDELGFTITEAKNGKEAVDLFAESAPYTYDFIFMDVMMPVMDGLEATREIRAMQRQDAESVPIIAMTANAFIEDQQACIEAGMNAHIRKPIDMKTVNETVRAFLPR